MSIVRIGMSEDGKFGSGYDAIFGPPPEATAKKPAAKKTAKKPAKATAKKPTAKKSSKKK
jgi:hypothetical protein